MDTTRNELNAFSRVINKISHGIHCINEFVIIAMLILVVIEVISRYFFRRPIVLAMELSGYFIIALTFLSAAYILQLEKHIAVDFITSRLPRKARAILQLITNLAGFVLCVIFVWAGIVITLQAHFHGYHSLPPLSIPMAIIYFIVPFGSFLLGLQFVMKMFDFKKHFNGWVP